MQQGSTDGGSTGSGSLHIGVSERSGYGGVDARTGARWMIERVRAARDAGLESFFLGEHHATGGTYYQNAPMLGRLLAEWGERPVGALFLLPLWHPVLLAEQVGTLASLASGRFILQCALGGGDDQFGGMGVPLRGRVARFESTLAVLRRLLAGEEVTTSEPLALRAARSGPLPPEPVDVWIGASAPAAIDRAARLGDGWIAAPGLTPAQAAGQLEQYRSGCATHGRPVGVTAIRRDVHVGTDAADAWRVADPILAAGYRGFPRESLVVGGVDQVSRAFADLGDLGYSHVLVRHLADDQGEVLASYERLGAVRSGLAGS
jgi:alkanesulfonate monooxygenase SsuD/methylene tetrahydromethanopterin reductase-like flavin-dependent oxidoreductase (luciferase family)